MPRGSASSSRQAAKRKASSSTGTGDEPSAKRSKSSSKVEEGAGSVGAEGQCWLFKSEPETRIEKGVDVKFGIDDLAKEPDQTGCWDGVRNYQARNFMRDRMRIGELGFFYHSNCKEPGIAGIVRIVKEGYTDHTQFDRSDVHYDPKSKKEDPKWFMVDVKLVRKLKRFVPLSELKVIFQKHSKSGGPLAKVALFCSARLSVQPVTQAEFDFIVELSETKKIADN